MRISEHTSYKSVNIELNYKVYNEINKNWKNVLETISKKYDIIVWLKESNELSYEKVKIIYNT